jgi:hypothetical protein
MPKEKLTPGQEQELADKINALCQERLELELKRGNGVSLDKSGYISARETEIEKELSKLKTPKPPTQDEKHSR